MTRTNIKNLPMGPADLYYTERGYSQLYVWKEIKRTAKTRTLARVLTELDPEWKEKMIWHAGGFAGHCENQHDQTWLYAGVDMEQTVTVREVKSRYIGEDTCWGYKGRSFAEGRAFEFYDYNF
jgi:hypothetical protein